MMHILLLQFLLDLLGLQAQDLLLHLLFQIQAGQLGQYHLSNQWDQHFPQVPWVL
jgi:hypothetical protein